MNGTAVTGELIHQHPARRTVDCARFSTLRKWGPGDVVRQGVSVSVAARNDVFISYSHRDAGVAGAFAGAPRAVGQQRPAPGVGATGASSPATDGWKRCSKAVARARVAILLVSPDYLASRFIAREELTPILRAAESDGLRIFWIPVRASIVDKTELAALQAAQPPDKPLAALRGAAVDRALASIARSIYEVFEQSTDHPDETPTTFAEVRSPADTRMVPFGGERVTVGRAIGNDVVLVDDEASRWHAVFERLGAHWYVRRSQLQKRHLGERTACRLGTAAAAG